MSKCNCCTCKFAWFGAIIRTGHGSGCSQWHCRIPNKPLVLIGNDKDFALSKACKAMVKL